MRAKMSPVVTTLAREHCCVATINEQGSRTPQPPNPNPNPNSNPSPSPSPHSPSFSDCLRRGVRNQVCCGVRDLGRLADAAERRPRHHSIVVGRVFQDLVRQRGSDVPVQWSSKMVVGVKLCAFFPFGKRGGGPAVWKCPAAQLQTPARVRSFHHIGRVTVAACGHTAMLRCDGG